MIFLPAKSSDLLSVKSEIDMRIELFSIIFILCRKGEVTKILKFQKFV